jgi:hypothetical protein
MCNPRTSYSIVEDSGFTTVSVSFFFYAWEVNSWENMILLGFQSRIGSQSWCSTRWS